MKERYYFSNGSEHRDWEEVWCNRCANDHDMHSGGDGTGCELAARMVFGEDVPELVEASYTIHFDEGAHSITRGQPTIPAALFCTAWRPCEEPCLRHPWANVTIRRIERDSAA